MSAPRTAEKAPLIEQVAELALRLSQPHLSDDGSTKSRHDFTQRQRMSCLVLRAYLKTTGRGVLECLAVSATLRERLGLTEKLPHFTTLQKFSLRSNVVAIVRQSIARIGQAAARPEPAPVAAAMDATGLSGSTASEYFRSRRGNQCQQWVQVSVVVLGPGLWPVGMVLSLGPSHDRTQAEALGTPAQAGSRPAML